MLDKLNLTFLLLPTIYAYYANNVNVNNETFIVLNPSITAGAVLEF